MLHMIISDNAATLMHRHANVAQTHIASTERQLRDTILLREESETSHCIAMRCVSLREEVNIEWIILDE
jgi:hypothetical protein